MLFYFIYLQKNEEKIIKKYNIKYKIINLINLYKLFPIYLT